MSKDCEARDIDDACSLTSVMLEDVRDVILRLPYYTSVHSEMISVYNPEHPALSKLKKLEKLSEKFDEVLLDILKELK